VAAQLAASQEGLSSASKYTHNCLSDITYISPIPFTKENLADDVRPIKYFSGKITTKKATKTDECLCTCAVAETDTGIALPKIHQALKPPAHLPYTTPFSSWMTKKTA
jgi:hypothetical protein